MTASEGDDAVEKLRLLGNDAFKARRQTACGQVAPAQLRTRPHARARVVHTRSRRVPQAGRFQEAFDSYTQALSIDRSDPRLYSNRSATCLKLNVPLQARVPLHVCACARERPCRLAGAAAGSRLTRRDTMCRRSATASTR